MDSEVLVQDEPDSLMLAPSDPPGWKVSAESVISIRGSAVVVGGLIFLLLP